MPGLTDGSYDLHVNGIKMSFYDYHITPTQIQHKLQMLFYINTRYVAAIGPRQITV